MTSPSPTATVMKAFTKRSSVLSSKRSSDPKPFASAKPPTSSVVNKLASRASTRSNSRSSSSQNSTTSSSSSSTSTSRPASSFSGGLAAAFPWLSSLPSRARRPAAAADPDEDGGTDDEVTAAQLAEMLADLELSPDMVARLQRMLANTDESDPSDAVPLPTPSPSSLTVDRILQRSFTADDLMGQTPAQLSAQLSLPTRTETFPPR